MINTWESLFIVVLRGNLIEFSLRLAAKKKAVYILPTGRIAMLGQYLYG